MPLSSKTEAMLAAAPEAAAADRAKNDRARAKRKANVEAINKYGKPQEPKCRRCESRMKTKPKTVCMVWDSEEAPSPKCSLCVEQGQSCTLDSKVVEKSSIRVEAEDVRSEPEDSDLEGSEAGHEGNKRDKGKQVLYPDSGSEDEVLEVQIPVARRPKRTATEDETSEASSTKRARGGLLSQLRKARSEAESPNLLEVVTRMENLEKAMVDKFLKLKEVEESNTKQAKRIEELVNKMERALEGEQ